jgi:LmbE family N-acetylglucosaminyl deacetylase
MEWIYLSPHFDDVALSCGGLLWEQAKDGENVSVWTICASEAPSGQLSPFAQSLHARWESGPNAIALRRSEDLRSCQLLGAEARHFGILDCIYRRDKLSGIHLYDSEDALFGELHPLEEPLVAQLGEVLADEIPPEAQVAAPLAVGGHVDHRLVQQAALRLDLPIWHYADYPYIEFAGQAEWVHLARREHVDLEVSNPGLEAWIGGIAAHTSQVSTFWSDLEAMAQAITNYHGRVGGVRLFKS